jgi:hypothetical protein
MFPQPVLDLGDELPGVGPELKIPCCDALLFWRVLDRVFVVLEQGAERQR